MLGALPCWCVFIAWEKHFTTVIDWLKRKRVHPVCKIRYASWPLASHYLSGSFYLISVGSDFHCLCFFFSRPLASKLKLACTICIWYTGWRPQHACCGITTRKEQHVVEGVLVHAARLGCIGVNRRASTFANWPASALLPPPGRSAASGKLCYGDPDHWCGGFEYWTSSLAQSAIDVDKQGSQKLALKGITNGSFGVPNKIKWLPNNFLAAAVYAWDHT